MDEPFRVLIAPVGAGTESGHPYTAHVEVTPAVACQWLYNAKIVHRSAYSYGVEMTGYREDQGHLVSIEDPKPGNFYDSYVKRLTGLGSSGGYGQEGYPEVYGGFFFFAGDAGEFVILASVYILNEGGVDHWYIGTNHYSITADITTLRIVWYEEEDSPEVTYTITATYF